MKEVTVYQSDVVSGFHSTLQDLEMQLNGTLIKTLSEVKQDLSSVKREEYVPIILETHREEIERFYKILDELKEIEACK